MAKTIDKYQRSSYGALDTNQSPHDTQSCYQEYLKLKEKVEVLQRSQRNFLGEDLGILGTNELENLESQLDSTLKQIRFTKTKYMLDQISEFQRKEEVLMETNNDLRNKLQEINTALQSAWETSDQNVTFNGQLIDSDGFVDPSQGNSQLQIGGETDQVTVTSTGHINGFMPGWML